MHGHTLCKFITTDSFVNDIYLNCFLKYCSLYLLPLLNSGYMSSMIINILELGEFVAKVKNTRHFGGNTVHP